jgi:hypothetical protein
MLAFGLKFNSTQLTAFYGLHLEKGLLKPEDLERIFDPKRLLNEKIATTRFAMWLFHKR